MLCASLRPLEEIVWLSASCALAGSCATGTLLRWYGLCRLMPATLVLTPRKIAMLPWSMPR